MISVKTASELYKVPKTTLYDLIRRGKLKVFRHPLGRRVLIPEEEYLKLQALSEFYASINSIKEEGEEK